MKGEEGLLSLQRPGSTWLMLPSCHKPRPSQLVLGHPPRMPVLLLWEKATNLSM